METVKSNICLEQRLHTSTTKQWTMPWIDSFVWIEFHQSSFHGTWLLQVSPLFEAYKSHFLAFHECLEMTHIS